MAFSDAQCSPRMAGPDWRPTWPGLSRAVIHQDSGDLGPSHFALGRNPNQGCFL